MAENNSAISPESNVQSMREALYAQKHLLQQLSTELDEEREAAGSAASEALSMILRLQGEKASLKMEASQYKRIAEEKMCHAEEALAVFEDLIYQREMEIASLEFQVQAYRYRLISMGCSDLGVYETKYPENMLIQRNDNVFVEKGVPSGGLRRLGSLPQGLNLTKDSSKRSSFESRRSVTPPKLDSAAGSADESSSCKDIDGYWEQIKRMDERVKEISESRESVRNKCSIWKGSTWSPSMFAQAGIGSHGDSAKESDAASLDQMRHPESPPCVKAAADSAALQDIYEIPPVDETKERLRSAQDGNQGLEKASPVSADGTKLHQKDDSSRIRKPPHSTITELRIPKPRHGISVERTLSVGFREQLTAVDSHSDYQQLVHRLERLEAERAGARQEITSEGHEELHLLKEIHEEIKAMHSEMSKWRAEKSRPRRDPPLDPLREAMLYFWM